VERNPSVFTPTVTCGDTSPTPPYGSLGEARKRTDRRGSLGEARAREGEARRIFFYEVKI
jgi:hypothetical protein